MSTRPPAYGLAITITSFGNTARQIKGQFPPGSGTRSPGDSTESRQKRNQSRAKAILMEKIPCCEMENLGKYETASPTWQKQMAYSHAKP